MLKGTIERRASDNKYLHRDFHCALDQGLAYLGAKYGGAAVDEYLGGFAASYYAPLISEAKARGLPALRAHIAGQYAAEGAPEAVSFAGAEGELKVSVSACPAVSYMRGAGHAPSKWYAKATSAVFKAVADGIGIGFALDYYDEGSGAAEYRFFALGEERL